MVVNGVGTTRDGDTSTNATSSASPTTSSSSAAPIALAASAPNAAPSAPLAHAVPLAAHLAKQGGLLGLAALKVAIDLPVGRVQFLRS